MPRATQSISRGMVRALKMIRLRRFTVRLYRAKRCSIARRRNRGKPRANWEGGSGEFQAGGAVPEGAEGGGGIAGEFEADGSGGGVAGGAGDEDVERRHADVGQGAVEGGFGAADFEEGDDFATRAGAMGAGS